MNADEIRKKAILEIDARRQRAQNEEQRRKLEIQAKIPEIAVAQGELSNVVSKLTKLILSGKSPDTKEKLEQIKNEIFKAEGYIKTQLVSHGYPEDYLKIKYTCPICEDRGFVEKGRCDCLKSLIRELSSKELNRTANMPNSDFEHFSLDYYRGIHIEGKDCHSLMTDVYNFCYQYAESFSPEHSQSLLMIGKTGTGKTHLSISIAKRVMDRGYTVVYGSVVNFLLSLEKEHFGRAEVSDATSSTLQVLLDCDLLILDDLGSEHHTAFYESTLYNIINTRINLNKPVIISTNLSSMELQAIYNERIVSRLTCSYLILRFLGIDIRQQKRFGQSRT